MRSLTRSTRVGIFSVLVVGVAGLTIAGSTSQALARQGCSNETAAGEYALQATGLTEGLSHTTADLGRIVVDGRGRLAGQLTVSVNGRIAQGQALAGTYGVQPDCTGAETFTIGADP